MNDKQQGKFKKLLNFRRKETYTTSINVEKANNNVEKKCSMRNTNISKNGNNSIQTPHEAGRQIEYGK